MIARFIEWLFAPTQKPIICDDIDVYERMLELEARIEKLEEENIELTNSLYEVSNSLEARIDILVLEFFNDKKTQP